MIEIPALRGWLAKSTRAPLLVSSLLGASIAVEVTRASLSLLGGHPADSGDAAREFRGARGTQHGANADAIIAAHLFGIAEDDRGTRDPAQAPPSISNLILTGTISTGDPKHGVAIVRDDGLSEVCSVGDSVGGASLHSVYRDHVILDRSGRFEKLMLPRSLPASERSTQLPAGDAAHTLGDLIRVGASLTSEAGKLRGFRISPGKSRAAFDAAGLHGGDLVVAINGTSLQDQDRQHGQEIFDTIKASAFATLTIERLGETRDVTIDTTQLYTDGGNVVPPMAAAETPDQ
jgi:general secretion pathway protein C